MSFHFDGKLRDMHGRRVRLGKAATAEVMEAWQQWCDRYDTDLGKNTRAEYDEMNRRGKHLVDVQSKHGVWLIHPANANAGLRPDDPRIID